MSSPQKPRARLKQKRRRARKLADWRLKQETAEAGQKAPAKKTATKAKG